MRSPRICSVTSINTGSGRPRPPSSGWWRRCRQSAARCGKGSWLTTSPKASLNADYLRTEISRWQARSMTISTRGIVSAESPLAAQAGAVVLARGGHAAEAAVAANAVMGVVAPMMNGIGGDLFAIVYEAKTGKLYGVNASGWAPANLSIDKLTKAGHRTMPQRGIDAVTVPGTVEGWDKLLSRYGTKKFTDVLAPAIRYADEGFPVSELNHSYWVASERAIRRDGPASKTFLPGGNSPATG